MLSNNIFSTQLANHTVDKSHILIWGTTVTTYKLCFVIINFISFLTLIGVQSKQVW